MKRFLLTFLSTFFGILTLLSIIRYCSTDYSQFRLLGELVVFILWLLVMILGCMKKISKIWILNVCLTILYFIVSDFIYFLLFIYY